MKVEMHTFFVRLDVAGQLPTVIDRELAAATAALSRGNIRDAQRSVATAHAATAKLGAALADLEGWGKAVPATADVVPAQRGQVVDVGGGESNPYRGSVDYRALTLSNWAFFQNHNLGARAADIFTSHYQIGDPSQPGHLYHPGDLANAKEDPQIPGGPSLVDFLS